MAEQSCGKHATDDDRRFLFRNSGEELCGIVHLISSMSRPGRWPVVGLLTASS